MAELDKTGLEAAWEAVKAMDVVKQGEVEAAISAYLSSTSAGVTEEQAPRVTDAMVEAACAATVLGEDEFGKPVHLSPAEARCALEASRVAPVSQKEAVPVAWQNIAAPYSILTPEQYGMRLPMAEGRFRPLYASPAPAVEPVGIKALEWTEMPERPYGYKGFLLYRIDSTNSLLNYRITYAVQGELDRFGKPWTQRYADYPRYELDAPHGSKGGNFDTLDAAKAAAQADHEARIRSALHTTPTPVSAHPDDLAVDRFAAAMKAKLAKKREEGRGGWDGPTCSAEILSQMLRKHVEKGDPVDVANLAMMLQQRGEGIVSGETVELAQQVLDFFKTARADGLYIGAGKNLRLPDNEAAQYGPLAKALLANAHRLTAPSASAQGGDL